MTVYAVLAIDSTFSSQPERGSEASLFAKIAVYAANSRRGGFNIQPIYRWLLFALYHFSLCSSQTAWGSCGRAIRVASGLSLNQASECQDTERNAEYGLIKHTLVECCRKTFWSVHVTDVSPHICRTWGIHAYAPTESQRLLSQQSLHAAEQTHLSLPPLR